MTVVDRTFYIHSPGVDSQRALAFVKRSDMSNANHPSSSRIETDDMVTLNGFCARFSQVFLDLLLP
jgi:hypothetical protein